MGRFNLRVLSGSRTGPIPYPPQVASPWVAVASTVHLQSTAEREEELVALRTRFPSSVPSCDADVCHCLGVLDATMLDMIGYLLRECHAPSGRWPCLLWV